MYDNLGRYVDTTYECLGREVSSVLSRNNLGAPLQVISHIDISHTKAVSTYYAYTPRGIRYLEASDIGSWQATTLKSCASGDNCPAGAVYFSKARAAGGGESRQYFDVLGRVMRQASVGFDGQWIINTDTEFDSLGRVLRKSEPSVSGASDWTTMSYDILGRATQVTLPDNSTGTTAYNGLGTVSTNALGQSKTEIKNALNETIQVTDHLGGDAYYHYDAQGNMTQLIDNAGNTTTLTYDVLGRKTAMNDPDKGNWVYTHNGFGELISQTDAKGQQSVMRYDRMGRMTGRTDYQSDGTIEGDTTWRYGTATNGLWQLDYVEDTISGYLKVIEYDKRGRVSKTVTSLGIAGSDGDHYEKVTYDQYGRIFQVFDAARDDDSYTNNGVENRYNAHGYQHQLVDAFYIGNQPATIYRDILTMDARGNVTSEILGNNVTTVRNYDQQTGRLADINATSYFGTAGDVQDLSYQWDALGNLSSRTEQSGNKNLSESFSYDGLNRLKIYQVAGQSGKVISYDLLGNITHKSDIGSYSYGTGVASSGAGPHAVTSAGGILYAYDANGNNVSSRDDRLSEVPSNNERDIDYTTFDKAKTITKVGHTTTFAYGADRKRYKRTDSNGNGTRTTLYIGGVEKITKTDGSTQVKRTIGGIAIITIEQEETTEYLYKDHLGSIDVITDHTGGVVQEQSFDTWGLRRSAVDWLVLSESVLMASFGVFTDPITTRGFTGHEMADEVGIIHINGRIYDPRIGRFLQADPFVQEPFVQEPFNTQSLNRYSYVLNNPLNATDPSGYFVFTAAAIVSSALAAAEVITVTTAVIASFSIAFAGALYYGGDLGDAFITGVSAAAMTYVGSEFALSGNGFTGGEALGFASLGGITSSLQGGNFGHGFFAAGAGAYFGGKINPAVKGDIWSSIGQTTKRMVLSGSISEATGGKFANGAATGAFLAAMKGFLDYATETTDNLKLKSCGLGGSVCKYNDTGELLTDGGRGSLQIDGTKPGDGNFLTNGGMPEEASGKHLYNENSLIGRFVNKVSKTHDYFNSHGSKLFGFKGYDSSTGLWLSGSETYNTTYQIYSFSGMLPAGVMTGAALAGDAFFNAHHSFYTAYTHGGRKKRR